MDATGNAYVTGQFYGTNATFYDAAGQQANAPTWNSVGNNDGYVIKYDPNGNLWQPSLPVVSTPPQSTAIVAGGSVTFTVAASGYTPILYQWQRNGVNVVGATSASYTPPSPTLADHGAQFTCVVSNYGGTTNSAAATLNVFATAIEVWRFSYFGTNANTGSAADDADPDKDGLKNLIEYALGSDPLGSSASAAPVAGIVGGNLSMTVTQLAAVSGITYGAEWSATLNGNDWQAIADSGTGLTHAFSNPIGSASRMFMRMKITTP